MKWSKYMFRMSIAAVLICAILYWAEAVMPMGSILVLLLLLSMVVTWFIINLLKDEDLLADMFDDER